MRSGLTMRASTTTGRQVTDTCELIYDSPSQRNCHVALPFQTTFSGLVGYTVPKIALQTSAVFRTAPGTQISANQVVPSATVAQTLGRPLSGGAANVTINLVNPGDLYRDRVNQLDLRFGRTFTVARKKLNVGLDMFNALNASAVLNSNNTYGAAWQTPTSIQQARQLQVSARFDF